MPPGAGKLRKARLYWKVSTERPFGGWFIPEGLLFYNWRGKEISHFKDLMLARES